MNIYDNNNYKVVASKEHNLYEIVNIHTGIYEGREQILPKAIVCADTWSDAIDRHKQKSKEKSNVVDIGSPR